MPHQSLLLQNDNERKINYDCPNGLQVRYLLHIWKYQQDNH